MSSQLWPMQFSDKVTLLTWECMQNNALSESVATQVAKKVLPQSLCTSSSLWYLSVASSSVYIKQSLVSICCLKLCVHQAVSGIYLMPQALCTSSSLWYLSVGHLVARPTKLYCHVTQTIPNPKPSHRRCLFDCLSFCIGHACLNVKTKLLLWLLIVSARIVGRQATYMTTIGACRSLKKLALSLPFVI